MSLKGVIKGISSSEGTNVSTFDKATKSYKDAIAKFTGVSIINNSDEPQGLIEGIVQGDIKLSANNNWNSTLYYGFTDAAGKVGFQGTQASSLIKLSNTLMNAAGYTLGGTGPASKKMYQGSNLSGFTVQFKWYTPLMTGWKDAIQALTMLAWPTTVNASNAISVAKVELPAPPAEGTPGATVIEGLKNRIADHTNDANALIKLINAAIPMTELKIHGEPSEIRSKYPFTSKFGDIMDEYDTWANSSPTERFNMSEPYSKILFWADSNMDNAIEKDKTNLKALEGTFQFTEADIGLDRTYWDNTDTPSYNPTAIRRNSEGVAAASTPSKQPPEISVVGAFKDLLNGTTQLLTGMMESIAVNPPKVSLEIFSGTSLKYRLAPLVITGFTINASRETIDGEPVIVTVDITFDYYMVNATGATTGEGQLFAGSPIFAVPKTPIRN